MNHLNHFLLVTNCNKVFYKKGVNHPESVQKV